MSLEDKKKFAPPAPDFVLEIRSVSDSLKELQNKMMEWIDPVERKAYVYREQGLKQILSSFTEKRRGDDVLPGFELDLSLLK